MECNEAAVSALCSAEVVESVMELTKSELSLAGNDTP